MLTKPRYSVVDMLWWTRRETIVFTLYASALTALYSQVHAQFLQVPWAPVSVIGTAVAFIIGFQNNAAYGRIWEARKIWGGIVNASRALGIKTIDFVRPRGTAAPTDAEIAEQHTKIIHRHVAWMTALRHAMRQPKKWEEFESEQTNREWSRQIHIPERVFSFEEEVLEHLPEAELAELETRFEQSDRNPGVPVPSLSGAKREGPAVGVRVP